MHAVIQHRFSAMPSLKLPLSVSLVAAALVMALATTMYGVPGITSPAPAQTPQNSVHATPSAEMQTGYLRLPMEPVASSAAQGAAATGQRWPSDVMDSHESVPSLAALGSPRAP